MNRFWPRRRRHDDVMMWWQSQWLFRICTTQNVWWPHTSSRSLVCRLLSVSSSWGDNLSLSLYVNSSYFYKYIIYLGAADTVRAPNFLNLFFWVTLIFIWFTGTVIWCQVSIVTPSLVPVVPHLSFIIFSWFEPIMQHPPLLCVPDWSLYRPVRIISKRFQIRQHGLRMTLGDTLEKVRRMMKWDMPSWNMNFIFIIHLI